MRIAALALSLFAACSHATIADTPIEDTKENREVLGLLAKYKVAAESRDVGAVLALVSPEYMDVAIPGRGQTTDFKGLQGVLGKQFERKRTFRLEVHPREVRVVGDKANLDFFFVARYEVALPSGAKWFTESDDARLKLARQGGQWKIVSGL